VLAALGTADKWRYEDTAVSNCLTCWSIIPPAVIALGLWQIRPKAEWRFTHETLSLLLLLLGASLAAAWALHNAHMIGLVTDLERTYRILFFVGGYIGLFTLPILGLLQALFSVRWHVLWLGVAAFFGLFILTFAF
jgi:hypothetical protein